MKKILTNRKVIAAFVGALTAAGIVALIQKRAEIHAVIEDVTDEIAE